MWHHRPVHVFEPGAYYMVTAGRLRKEHFFTTDDRLEILLTTLQNTLAEHEWILQGWALFSNHYHFIARAPSDASTLRQVIRKLHSVTAREINHGDMAPGRRVWFQYWDTSLTYEKSYLVRLNYVSNNAVHHGLVRVASLYRFCSAGWFESQADPSFRRKVESYRSWDRLKLMDDY